MNIEQNRCLELATNLQGKMLPTFAPDILGLDVIGACHYATKLGEDFLTSKRLVAEAIHGPLDTT